jgi:hypothetical protein
MGEKGECVSYLWDVIQCWRTGSEESEYGVVRCRMRY